MVAASAAAVSCSSADPAPRVAGMATSSGTVPKRRLGRTNEQVSMIGIGGAHLGKTRDEQEAVRIVRMAIDRGATFLDNCWDYHAGMSEERMGKALRDGYRARAFLMTKIDGRTKKAALGQIDQSLRRLQTDHLDLLQVHEVIRASDAARVFSQGGAFEALLEAQQAGKTRFFGFTGHKDPALHMAMLQAGLDQGFTFDAVQMPLNAMDPHYRSFERTVLPALVQHDIGVLGMKSMGDGELLKSGAVSARECLRYALSLPTSVVITGCESVEILEQALDVAVHFQPMSDVERRELLARTASVAKKGKYELFKTTEQFDSTAQHPSWLEEARI